MKLTKTQNERLQEVAEDIRNTISGSAIHFEEASEADLKRYAEDYVESCGGKVLSDIEIENGIMKFTMSIPIAESACVDLGDE